MCVINLWHIVDIVDYKNTISNVVFQIKRDVLLSMCFDRFLWVAICQCIGKVYLKKKFKAVNKNKKFMLTC